MSVYGLSIRSALCFCFSFLFLSLSPKGQCSDPYFLSSKFLETTQELRDGIHRPVVLKEEILEYGEAQRVFKASREGDGDFTEAFKLFKKSAEKGHADGQHRLGMLYEQGRGTGRDLNKALTWYQKAYKKGLFKSGFDGIRLSWMMLGEEDAISVQVDKSFRELMTYVSVLKEQSSDQVRSSDGQYRLGILNGEGLGTEVNSEEAFHHFEEAVKEGDVGFIEDFSLGVPPVIQDVKTRFHGLLRKCVETTCFAAQKLNQNSVIKWLESRDQLWQEKGFKFLFIPLIARGYEDIYRQFFTVKLIYRPNPQSDDRKIELLIGGLANPLEGTFDLSRCGDTGKHLSIATGYRKGKKAENANKIEVWIAPRFLINQELGTSATYLAPMMDDWNVNPESIGLLWTWGGADNQHSVYCNSVDMTKNMHQNFSGSGRRAPVIWAQQNQSYATAQGSYFTGVQGGWIYFNNNNTPDQSYPLSPLASQCYKMLEHFSLEK